MAYPIRAVTRPAVLAGLTNGKLAASILVTTPGLAGGPVVTLVAPAARAWRVLTAAAQAAGHVLKAISTVDSYRPYDVQERTFRARYTTSRIAGAPTRTWQGQTWYQRPGTAAAAVPGTSNHGWGLAVDVGEERDGDPAAESLDSGTLAWLVAHAGVYGWSWELQSEPWHLRYYAGDAIPAAVLAYERGGDIVARVVRVTDYPDHPYWVTDGAWRKEIGQDQVPRTMEIFGQGDLIEITYGYLSGLGRDVAEAGAVAAPVAGQLHVTGVLDVTTAQG